MAKIRDFFKKRKFEICLGAFLALFAFTAVRVRVFIASRGSSARAEAAPAALSEPQKAPDAEYLPGRGACLLPYSPDKPVWSETMRQYAVHAGADFACDPDGSVYACRAGRVESVVTDCLYGLTLTVADDDGTHAMYASLSEALASPGDRVAAGDRIGRAGTSAACEAHLGAHVHFALYMGDQPVAPPFSAE